MYLRSSLKLEAMVLISEQLQVYQHPGPAYMERLPLKVRLVMHCEGLTTVTGDGFDLFQVCSNSDGAHQNAINANPRYLPDGARIKILALFA
jgi:hypothetical protein